MKTRLLYFYIFFFSLNCSLQAQSTDDLDLKKLILPTDSCSFFKDKNNFNWCNSLIKDEAGNYNLFYSRWPKKFGFLAWLTHSEIARSTSKNMTGPYVPGETVLKKREGFWDNIMTHNVKVEHFNNKFYMYYISTNTGDQQLSQDKLIEIAQVGYSHPEWNLLRSNQRTGIAVSNNLDGPWIRQDTPLIEPHGPIKTVTVNPAICMGPDENYYMIIKGDDRQVDKGRLIQAIARSKTPTGPFILEEKPAFADIPTEDVSIWYDYTRRRFYGIFHAHGDNFLGLITSEDGVNWQKANHYEVCKKEILLSDGSIMKVDRMERPYVFIEDGIPKVLICSVQKGNDAFIVFLKLQN